MIKNSTFLIFCVISFLTFNSLNAQLSCPQIDKRNNGNGQWASAPGDFRPTYTQNNPVNSNVSGTSYQLVKVNPNTKTGGLTIKWDNLDVKNIPVITKVWHTDVTGKSLLLSTVFGPPAPVQSGEDKAVYCFYGTNLPSTGTLSLEFTNPTTAIPLYYCSFDAKKLEYVNNPIITAAYPTILTQPLSKTEIGDGSTSFSVVANDSYSYKWQISSNGTIWTDINGGDFVVTSGTLKISNRLKYNNYSFRVVLSNLYGSVTSSSALLTIDNLPTVSFEGATKTCDVNLLSGVKVNLTGISPWAITYKLNNEAPITLTGITTPSYIIPIQSSSDLTLALLSVSDKKYTNSNITNNIYNSYVTPSINVNNINVLENETNINLNFTTSGLPDKYNLTSIGNSITGLLSIVNPISTSIIQTQPLVVGNYNYSIVVTNTNSNCISKAKTFSIIVTEKPLSFKTQPTSITYLENGIARFGSSSLNAKNYEWQVKNSNDNTWVKLTSNADFTVTNDSLIIQNRKNHNGEVYRLVLSNNSSVLASDEVVLTIDNLPTVAFEGATKTCDVNLLTGVKVNLTGISPWTITYKLNNEAPITLTGITTPSYIIPIQSSSDLTLTLLSVNDSKYTNSTLNNNVYNAFVAPLVLVNDITNQEGDTSIILNFTTTGSPDKYTLTASGNAIPGFSLLENDINSTLIKIQPLTVGNYNYTLKVSNSITGCESSNVPFTINALENQVSLTKQPLDTSFFLLDGTASIYASANNATNYTWQKSLDQGKNWSLIVNDSDFIIFKDSLLIKNRMAHSKEMYRVVYSNNSGSVTSNPSLLYIEQMPVAYFKNTVHCDVDIVKAVPVLFEGLPPFELVYQVEGVPGEEAHFVPNIKTNVYNIIVGGLTKQTNIKLLKVNNKRHVNTNLTKDALFTSYKKNTITSFIDTLIDEENKLVFKTTGDAYQTFSVKNGTTTFPNFAPINNAIIKDSSVVFTLPNTGETPGKYNFDITMNHTNGICYNSARVYITAIQNKLAILTQPTSQSYLENGNALFTLKSQNSTSYLWQYTFNDGATWNDISQGGNFIKVSKDTLELANRLFYKNNKFRIVLYGKYENVTSNVVTLSVERKPTAFFESSKKCYLPNAKSALVYLKGVAPFKISYVNELGVTKTDSNITKDVFNLIVDSTVNKLRLLSVSDSRFSNVALDSSNSIIFYNKPVYRPYLKTACAKDSLVELLFSGGSQPTSMTIKAGVNPIPGFASLIDVAFHQGYKLNLPKNLPLGTYGFAVVGNNANCSSDEVKINLSMNAIPVMNVSTDKTSINQGDSVTLVASGADVVRWSPVIGLNAPTAKTVNAKPDVTTIYTIFGYQNGCVGTDTVKISVNSIPTTSSCTPLSLSILPQDIKFATCNNADGEVTFTISGGSANNKYRVRKKNNDGSFTTITNPSFAPLNNQLDEVKTVTITNLYSGTYDVFTFCGTDSRVTKVYNFSISSPCDSVTKVDTTKNTTTPTPNYTCNDMVLTLDNTDVKPITCDYDFGSITFAIKGGSPNFTYRLRRRNQDNTYTIVTNPVYVSIGNKANEVKRITIDELTEGEYELYVYCSQDVTYFKSLSFYIYREGCRSLLKDVISYYSFDKNNNDSLARATAPVVVGAIKDVDNYGNSMAAFKVFNSNDQLTFKDFIDIDTMQEYSISFWYKLLEMPKYSGSTLISIPNGTQTQRFEIVADKNGYLKVQFGKSSNSSTQNTSYKFQPSTWNQIVLTHRQDSNIVFINDIQVASFVSSILSDNNTDVVVGYDGKNKSLKFLFDEFKLYGKAITAQDIKDMYFAEVRENCSGIRLDIDVSENKLKFVVRNGSVNNKYRLRKKNSNGVFVSVYDQTFVSIYNKLGESRTINTSNLSPGIYDIYAYCGSDSKKYQGYEFIVDNRGNSSIYKKITPTETIDLIEESKNETKEEIYVNVYPNPVENIINIDVLGSQNDIDKTIRLISSNGVIVHNETFNTSDSNTSINVENFRAGVYFLEVHLPGNRIERKQIVIN